MTICIAQPSTGFLMCHRPVFPAKSDRVTVCIRLYHQKLPTKDKWRGKKCSGKKKKTHFSSFTFCLLFMIIVYFCFQSPPSIVFVTLHQCMKPTKRDHLSTKIASICTKGRSLAGFSVCSALCHHQRRRAITIVCVGLF